MHTDFILHKALHIFIRQIQFLLRNNFDMDRSRRQLLQIKQHIFIPAGNLFSDDIKIISTLRTFVFYGGIHGNRRRRYIAGIGYQHDIYFSRSSWTFVFLNTDFLGMRQARRSNNFRKRCFKWRIHIGRRQH